MLGPCLPFKRNSNKFDLHGIMGICLDTEQHNEELETPSAQQTRGPSAWAGRATPPTAGFPMQNTSHVKFEPPNVPVIFVLGGPGSGKVTHCDNLMQERRGVIHINMTDLLQQYAIGNDMQDFGNLSSKTVTEVLMLEMKMAPTAKTYLVSGYPRSMRDVAEYSDKIQTISGAVLVSWRQRVLERQIEYGARLGHVVLSLARMELDNFYRHVMPVADYLDQSNMLIAVNGERNPEEVYKDFRAAVLQILGSTDEQSNGVGGIPGEIVGVERVGERDRDAAGLERDRERVPVGLERDREPVVPKVPIPVVPVSHTGATIVMPKPEINRGRAAPTKPAVVWVVGGPGSNKAALCQRAVSMRTGWTHFSLGQRLRALANAGGAPGSDGVVSRAALGAGELVSKELVLRLVRGAAADAARAGQGLLLDGYPRDLEQLAMFEGEFHVAPRMVLLDCSKLHLGRGRHDDLVAAFRRRLEVFREQTLPVLKTLDQDHRLVIVDGDSDSSDVQNEFTRVVVEEMEKAEVIAAIPSQPKTEPSAAMRQLAHAMSRMGNGHMNGSIPNGVADIPNGGSNGVGNGFLSKASKVKSTLDKTAKIPTVSQMTHDDVKRLYAQSSGDIATNTHI